MEKDYNNKIIYYCGDACGREKEVTPKEVKRHQVGLCVFLH
jgi:hypothetical protein